ncbi:hypothetical protein [Kitasatospora azatica]|uniref:hypothetical protein n=1 Tax=Kitasatospora azatica TaxID=58347 RepID=UPI00068CA084|nr:hypothetical protein [Kitasatospora azatica]
MNKAFVLRVVELAMARHRWDELGCEPPFVMEQLREFHRLVEAFDRGAVAPGSAPEEVDDLRCPRHRVLAPLACVDGCVFCTRGY